ncbi:MAG: hypothetical protein M0Z61_05350 [Nitrospiraceae bacterium]|nr:hypothetical protein [Nitrospiraceae bacterium]
MDLKEKLKLKNPKLFSDLEGISRFCTEIWKDTLLPWFTNHNCEHSEEIIYILGQILAPLENNPKFPDEHELFILLASAYLHDIGMQLLKIGDLSPGQTVRGRLHLHVSFCHARASCFFS